MLRPASIRLSPSRVHASKAAFAWLLAAALVAGGPLSAAEPAGDASLDQSLLEQLTEGLSTPEAVPATKPAEGKIPVKTSADPVAKPGDFEDPAAKKPAETKPTKEPAAPGPEGLDGDLLKELTGGLDGAAGEAAGEDAVAKIASRMSSVKDRLARAEAGGETRTLQDEIVAELDQLLKLQKQNQKQDQQSGSKQKTSSKQQSQKQKKPGEKQSAQNSPSGKQPQQGQEKDGDKPDGKSGKKPIDSDKNLDNKNVAEADPSLDALAQFMQAEWGHLPEKERNQVMQAFREKMLPQYDRLIRAYFEELARRGAQQ